MRERLTCWVQCLPGITRRWWAFCWAPTGAWWRRGGTSAKDRMVHDAQQARATPRAVDRPSCATVRARRELRLAAAVGESQAEWNSLSPGIPRLSQDRV